MALAGRARYPRPIYLKNSSQMPDPATYMALASTWWTLRFGVLGTVNQNTVQPLYTSAGGDALNFISITFTCNLYLELELIVHALDVRVLDSKNSRTCFCLLSIRKITNRELIFKVPRFMRN